jgi:hypothetical protein
VKFSSRRFAFEIPDAWWTAAGMVGFVAKRAAYRAGPPDNPDLATIVLLVDGIAVTPRGPGVPDFGRDRMVSVLEAIRLDAELPPIWITEASDGRGHVLYHGRHRLAASIAVGFPEVPAVIVRDLRELI